MPTFKDLGYTADIGQMHRILMAPRGIPADRLKKLRDAMAAIQKDKTYLRLVKAIGEVANFESGEDYEKRRPKQSAAYKNMIKGLASN